MPGCSWRGHLQGVHIHYYLGVLGGDTCDSEESPKVVRKNNDTAIVTEWVSDDEVEDQQQYQLMLLVGIKKLLSVVEVTDASYEVTATGYSFCCWRSLKEIF
ncbi:hypothetical protein Tco_1099476 [Tanacetum coccineum]